MNKTFKVMDWGLCFDKGLTLEEARQATKDCDDGWQIVDEFTGEVVEEDDA